MTAPESAAGEARKIPRADRLLAAAERAGWTVRMGHAPIMEAVRATLDEVRAEVLAGTPCPPAEGVEARLLERLEGAVRGTLRPVVNATGVVIHTNLGRAPLSRAAIEAMQVAAGYANLEYDLASGERGDRYGHATGALCRLTGAEAALAVNNCASAVLLALSALSERLPARRESASVPIAEAGAAGRPEVLVSRGQLVEIGGGFRVPDVLRRSGADLVEVGTTNRTYAADFLGALSPRSRILLSVHRSNFRIEGFVHDTSLAELADLGRRAGVWVVDDVGSGALFPTAPFGLGEEPTVRERVAAGADVVCFSGDKLLGGPQCGLLVGRREAIDLCRRHPLLRALRVDKVTLAGLAATLAHHERGEALREVPVWRAIAWTPEELRARAEAWREALGLPGVEVVEARSAVGGGTLPGVTLPTFALALPPGDPDGVAARLRAADSPVVGRIEEGRVLLDPRTVLPGEDAAVLAAVRAALSR
ncbi:MAG TPA: L-seryl-tRNA(Sec) selenium transferase [Anaeromyxobacteraceae bacterium]|nr:L-seryl-tRNA(Sec) selenium transferase [Anaeromyxobacteraceae bacterium]